MLEPQRVFGLDCYRERSGCSAPKPGALPAGPHPDSAVFTTQRKYYTRIFPKCNPQKAWGPPSEIRESNGSHVVQQPHEEKAQPRVHPQVDPVKESLPEGIPWEQEGLGQGTAFGPPEGEQTELVHGRSHPPGIPQWQPGHTVQTVPQYAHQPVGGARVLRILPVVVQHNAGHGNVGAELTLLGLGTVGGFGGAGTDPVEIHRVPDGQETGMLQRQLKHELTVLPVGQLRVSEIDPVGGEEASADETAPDHGSGTGHVVRQIALTAQGHLLGGEHLLKLEAAHHQLVAVLRANDAAQLLQNVRLDQIVRVHEPDVIPLGGGKSRVPGGGHAAVSLGDHPEVRVRFGKSPQNLAAFVRGAVVHANDLVVRCRKILSKQRVQAFLQIQLRVKNRNHNAQKQGLHPLKIKH